MKSVPGRGAGNAEDVIPVAILNWKGKAQWNLSRLSCL
jgi:hypothetical protein